MWRKSPNSTRLIVMKCQVCETIENVVQDGKDYLCTSHKFMVDLYRKNYVGPRVSLKDIMDYINYWEKY